jgi:hypothetical protein
MALMALLEMPLMFFRTIKYRSQKISHDLPVLIQALFNFFYFYFYFLTPFLNKAKGGKMKEGTERERDLLHLYKWVGSYSRERIQ